MEEPIYESNELNLFYHEDDDLSFLLSTKPFISDVSAQAAKIFSFSYDLYEKWCGFYPLTLGYCIYWHYIGRGYANTEKYIDLSECYKKFNSKEEMSVEKNEVNKGKVIRSLDSYGKETIDEYDDNGILIHHKDNCEESWWDGKGHLIHTKTKYLETFYEYDDTGRLIREFYPEGYEITYEFNPEGLLIEEKDSEGHRVINTYVNGVLTEKTCFNPDGQIVYHRTLFGSEYWTGYDDKGQVIYEVVEDGGEQRRYNSKGNDVFYLSYSSFAFKFYDSKDRVIYAVGSNIHNFGKVYDEKDRLEYEIDDCSKTVRDYDGHHLDVKEQDLDPYSICDRDGNPLYSYDKTKKEHKWFDDGNTYICRKLSEDEWDYEYEWLEYDANDNLVRRIVFSTDEFKEYYYEYDNKNNLVHLIREKGHQEWRDYDERGRLIHSKDIWGKETIFEYDNNNIPIHRSEMIGGQVWNDYIYSENEKLLIFKDIWGEERTFMCNEKNILISDDLRTQVQHYDYYYYKDLKILFSRDRYGKVNKYEYDENGERKEYVLNEDGNYEFVCSSTVYDSTLIDDDVPEYGDLMELDIEEF